MKELLYKLPVGIFVLTGQKKVIYANRLAKSFYRMFMHGEFDEDAAAGTALSSMFLNKTQNSWTFFCEETIYTITVNTMGREESQETFYTISVQMVDASDVAVRSSKPSYHLSPREEEIARLVLAGYSNKEIAAALTISVYTVNKHMENLFKKTKTNNRIAAASKALGRLTE